MRRFFENPLVFFWASRFSDISLDERIYSNKLNYATGPRRFLYYLFFFLWEGGMDGFASIGRFICCWGNPSH